MIDLHLGNILLRIPGIEQISHQDLRRYLGRPYKRSLKRWDGEPVTPSPHQPKYVVMRPGWLELLSLCLSSPEAVHIKICDFGEGFPWDDKPMITRLNTPCIYAAPDIIFQSHHPCCRCMGTRCFHSYGSQWRLFVQFIFRDSK